MFEGMERLRDQDLADLAKGAKAHGRDSRLMAAELQMWRQYYNDQRIAKELDDASYDGVLLRIPREKLNGVLWRGSFDSSTMAIGSHIFYGNSYGRFIIYKWR